MAYATRTDLEARYGAEDLAQREAMLTAGAVERALADASDEIDRYAGGRYALPIAPVPATIERITCALARYYLLGDSASEAARQAYDDARAFLSHLQAGKATLDGAAVAAPGSAAGAASVVASARLFSRDQR